jgi:hypothetical protein
MAKGAVHLVRFRNLAIRDDLIPCSTGIALSCSCGSGMNQPEAIVVAARSGATELGGCSAVDRLRLHPETSMKTGESRNEAGGQALFLPISHQRPHGADRRARIIEGADASATLGESVTQSEYKDLRIPLNVLGKASAGPAVSKDQALRRAAINAAPQATAIIAEVLGVEGNSGWQPEGPTDLPGLLLAGQAVWRQTGGIMFSWKFTFDSVTLRFQRSVSQADSVQLSARPCDQCGSPVGAAARFCSSCGAATTAAHAGEARTPGSAHCSFCGKSQCEVRVLVSGRGAFICDECIRLNQELASQ